MNKLNKIFQKNQVLTAVELNSITSKVDELIAALSSLEEAGSDDSNITEDYVQQKVNEAKAEVTALVNSAVANLRQNIEDLMNAPSGASSVVTEEQWAQYRKKVTDLETDVAAIKLSYDGIDLVALKQTVDDINTWAGSISVDPGKIEILAALLDENNELIIKPASIIAAITKSNGRLKSSITISADQVYLDGDVTVTNKLTALNADVSNLRASVANIDSASIKQAVIDDIEAGNVNVSGTLRFNKILGNVTNVSSSTQLSDNSYFINVDGGSTGSEPIITLPTNPEVGQTIFIYGENGYWGLKANNPIRYYKANWISDTEHEVSEGYVYAQQTIMAGDSGWFGVGQFIYDGTQWQQLTQNVHFRAGTRV